MTKRNFEFFMDDLREMEIETYEKYVELQKKLAYLAFNEKLTMKQELSAFAYLKTKAKKEWIEKDYKEAKAISDNYFASLVNYKGE